MAPTVRRKPEERPDLTGPREVPDPVASESGEPLSRQHVTAHRFKPLLRRAGLPELRFHDLRHTCATLLLSKNVNLKVVSEMLGRASIAITLDTYSHVLPTMQESAAKAMEDALS